MAFGKNIGLKGFSYQGGLSMLSWLLNRIAGLGMIIFVSLHVLASFLSQTGTAGDLGVNMNLAYFSLPFQLFIAFCVMFHTVHGLRVIVLDFWPQFLKHQQLALQLQWAIFLPVYGMTAFAMISSALASAG